MADGNVIFLSIWSYRVYWTPYMVIDQLDLFLSTKTQVGLLGFLFFFCSVTERAELFPPPLCGGNMQHFFL